MVCNDREFGPVVRDCRRDFDFTLCFEQTILSIAPATIFILVGVLRAQYLTRQPVLLHAPRFRILKLIPVCALLIIRSVLLGLWTSNAGLKSWSSTTAATLAVVDAFVLLVLVLLEHSRNLRPSSLVLVYLFLTIPLEAVQVRTIWLLELGSSIEIISLVSLAARFLVMVLEAFEKARYLPEKATGRCPEETSSVFNRGVFYWVSKLLWTGARRTLLWEHLYDLETRMSPDRAAAQFMDSWLSLHADQRRGAALKALWKVYRRSMLMAVFPRIILLIATICTPVLLNKLLHHLSDEHQSESSNTGYGLIGGFALVYFTISISTGFYWYSHMRTLTMIRGCLITVLAQKLTRLNLRIVEDSKAILTLMSTDVDRILQGLEDFHELWANLTQATVAAVLLAEQSGGALACIPSVALSVGCAVASVWSSRSASKKQISWTNAVQRRVSRVSTLLSCIKGVRLRALEDSLRPLVQRLRSQELQCAKQFRQVVVRTVVIGYTPELMAPALTFLVFTVMAAEASQGLDASKAFTTLSLLNILAQPLSASLQTLPALFAVSGCLDRIDRFLASEEHKDFRELGQLVRVHDKGTAEAAVSDQDLPGEGTRLEPYLHLRNHGQHELVARITDCDFGYEGHEAVIKHANAVIPRHKLTMILGPVASGKTTFCRALLGEVLIQGRCEVFANTQDTAYCDQDPFLINDSVKRNIIGFNEFDLAWYNTIVEACALKDDEIAVTSEWHNAGVGSNGVKLSGGQRQRVSIARALYARKPILVLDDVLSGLDSRTGRHLFANVLGSDGLARRHGLTVIFATHDRGWLPYADHVIVLGSNGCIVQQGLCDALRTPHKHSEGTIGLPYRDETVRKTVEDASDVYRSWNDSSQGIQPASANANMTRVSGDFSVYGYYLRTAGIYQISISLILGVAVATCFTIPSYWLKRWSSVSSDQHQQPFLYWGVYTGLSVSALLLLGAYAYHMFIHFVTRTGTVLHNHLLEAVLNATWSFLSSTDSGAIINRFSQDIQITDGQLPSALLNLILSLLFAVGEATLIVASSPWVGLAFPVILGTLYAVQKFYLKTSRRLRLLDLEGRSPLYTAFSEVIHGLSSIRAFDWTAEIHSQNQELLRLSQKPVYLLFMIQRWLTFVIDTIVACIAILIVAISVQLRASGGSTGLALTQIMSLNLMLRTIIQSWTSVETSIGAISRIKGFCEDAKSEHRLEGTIEPSANWPSQGAIKISGLTACYNSTTVKPVLKNLSVTIKPGTKVGVYGRSGSGKTSFFLALLHILEFHEGTIEIDDLDISHIPRKTLRSRITVIPQDPIILHETVRANLDPDGRLSDSALEQALVRVHMWNTIESRGGLTAAINFNSLSNGQRQLFCLCAALVNDARIMLLDEVTSNVDQKTDALVQQIIRDHCHGRTVVAIAHRLQNIVDFDQILLFENGCVNEVQGLANLHIQ